LCCLLFPLQSAAFCGFYVAGSDASLTADATQVVLMRHGTRTILSMQNNYKGPTEDFAMVVPVPQVLKKDQVKTLPKEAFGKIDRLTAPRLVEYWEQDPCNLANHRYDEQPVRMLAEADSGSSSIFKKRKPKVKVEAKFDVGEYNVVILSATESTALDTWLRQNDYNIPDGAAPYLEPYVQSGMYFFVARVDMQKVKQTPGGPAILSPLRFHYDNDAFFLPIRLGMINSAGKQDLLVYVLAQEQRYKVANRPNTYIPTNIEVKNGVRDNFPQFYDALFTRTLEDKPGAVVTEYAWSSTKCDPCPGPTLNQEDFLTFGADVLPDDLDQFGWVVTRLHARYSADQIGEDLVFVTSHPIVGGREVRDADGALERGAAKSDWNNFQGRYIIRHEWSGPVECENPRFGRWGGPPNGGATPGVNSAPSANTRGESIAAADVEVEELVKGAIPSTPVIPPIQVKQPKPTRASMCAGCSTAQAGSSGLLVLFVLGALRLATRRRRS
jgi:hypothetical protein